MSVIQSAALRIDVEDIWKGLPQTVLYNWADSLTLFVGRGGVQTTQLYQTH